MSPDGAEPPPGALRKLGEMYAFCQQAVCRHRALVTYFGQTYEREGCGACDVCLGETVQGADTSGVAAKILASVAELRGRFGATHVADVLRARGPAASASSVTTSSPPTAACAGSRKRACAAGSTSSWRTACWRARTTSTRP